MPGKQSCSTMRSTLYSWKWLTAGKSQPPRPMFDLTVCDIWEGNDNGSNFVRRGVTKSPSTHLPDRRSFVAFRSSGM